MSGWKEVKSFCGSETTWKTVVTEETSNSIHENISRFGLCVDRPIIQPSMGHSQDRSSHGRGRGSAPAQHSNPSAVVVEAEE